MNDEPRENWPEERFQCRGYCHYGILSPLRDGEAPLIEIDGPVFEQKEAWGHLLNEHYLGPMDDYLYPGDPRYGRDQDPFPCVGEQLQKPRLYGYFHEKNAP